MPDNDTFQYSMKTRERTTLYRQEPVFMYRVNIINPKPAREENADKIDEILKEYLGLENDS